VHKLELRLNPERRADRKDIVESGLSYRALHSPCATRCFPEKGTNLVGSDLSPRTQDSPCTARWVPKSAPCLTHITGGGLCRRAMEPTCNGRWYHKKRVFPTDLVERALSGWVGDQLSVARWIPASHNDVVRGGLCHGACTTRWVYKRTACRTHLVETDFSYWAVGPSSATRWVPGRAAACRLYLAGAGLSDRAGDPSQACGRNAMRASCRTDLV